MIQPSFALKSVCFFVQFFIISIGFSQTSPDPNLHIYLCYGQSNMSGQGPYTDADNTVSSRFKVLRAANHSGQTVGELYPAAPPLGHSGSQMGPADFFGRKMVQELPNNITVAVANMSIGGQSIDLFDKATKESYINNARNNNEWWLPYLDQYGGDVYNRIIETGNRAKQIGVIKGILFHQGEADYNRDDWASKVKKVYDDIIADLNLNSNDVPILIGELLTTQQGGDLGWRNGTVAQAANSISNGHLISAANCPGLVEPNYTLHFTREGYQILGERYADKMLELLDYDNTNTTSIWLDAECGNMGSLWYTGQDSNASNGNYITIAAGNNSTSSPPNDQSGQITYNFNINESGLYTLWSRIIAPTPTDDSFWIRVDNGSWLNWNNITPSTTWVWDDVNAYNLTAGSHTITIAYREDGASLDKLYLTNSNQAPSGVGSNSTNCSTNSSSVIVRARGTDGSEIINLKVDGTTLSSWNLTTTYQDYSVSTDITDTIQIEFSNDASARDVQIDYITVNNLMYESENQPINSGVWQNSSCGGSNSEWLHCNGYIEFNLNIGAKLIQQNLSDNSILVYPNPTKDFLSIKGASSTKDKISIRIYSIRGKLVKVINMNSAKRFDMSDLETGIYYLKGLINRTLINQKIIIN